jgi:hypothetical protein
LSQWVSDKFFLFFYDGLGVVCTWAWEDGGFPDLTIFRMIEGSSMLRFMRLKVVFVIEISSWAGDLGGGTVLLIQSSVNKSHDGSEFIMFEYWNRSDNMMLFIQSRINKNMK